MSPEHFSAGDEPDAGNRDVYLFLALLLSLVAALPLIIGAGILNTRAGGDSLFLVQRVHQLSSNLRAGIFPVRWMPGGAHGLGYPFFNFYAALPYYLASMFDLLGFGILWGIKLTQTLGFLLAGGTMYVLARELGASRIAALLGSAVYTFAPFHLVNVYVRGDALSEFFAYALYPLILYAVTELCMRRSVGRVALLAASYALLVLSHNISAMIFSPLLGLWLLAQVMARPRSERWSALSLGVLALALGLVLSMWYWAPALREQPLVQLQDQTTGYFHFAGHFRAAADLVQRRWVHDYAIEGHHNPFGMGLAQAVLAGFGLLALLSPMSRKGSPFWRGAIVLAFAAYTWLIMPSSKWVWEHVPLLPYAQFPWRMLSVQALVVALLALHIPDALPKRKRDVVVGALCVLVGLAGMLGLRTDRLSLSEADITPQRLMLYETYSGNIGTTVRYEYLPREMVPRPFVSGVQLNGGAKPAPLALEGELHRADRIGQQPTDETWLIETVSPALLAFHTAYYPGWRAWLDDRPQPVEPLPGLGLIGVRIPEGAHKVRLSLGPTNTRRYATWASAIGFLIWIVLLLYPALRARSYTRGLMVIGVLALVGLWFVLPKPGWNASAGNGPLVMDFVRAPYLHEEPQGVFFGGARLERYELDALQVQPGGTLHLTMFWQPAIEGAQIRLELTGATAHLFEHSPVWAEVATPMTERVDLEIALPPDIPPGLYVLRPTVLRGGQPLPIRTARGYPMGALALQPIQVIQTRRATGQEEALGSYGPERVPPVISLIDAGAKVARHGLLEVALTWRCDRQPPLNYMLSLRLKRGDGSSIVVRDLPPLLGGYPTSLWRAGELVSDRVLLPLPEGSLPAEDCALEIVLYDRLTLKAAGTAVVKGLRIE